MEKFYMKKELQFEIGDLLIIHRLYSEIEKPTIWLVISLDPFLWYRVDKQEIFHSPGGFPSLKAISKKYNNVVKQKLIRNGQVLMETWEWDERA